MQNDNFGVIGQILQFADCLGETVENVPKEQFWQISIERLVSGAQIFKVSIRCVLEKISPGYVIACCIDMCFEVS